MTSRNRFPNLAVTALLASLVLAGGSARAATITHFDGQFSSGPNGPNRGISANEPGTNYAGGTGQKIFYLSFGTVSSTRDPSVQWNGLSVNDLTVDVSAFTVDNPFGSVTAFLSGDATLLQAGQGTPHADFTMAATAKIDSNGVDHATIDIGVTLRGTSDGNGDDLTAFNTAGGGTFSIDIDNIQITQPVNDGRVFFPVDPTKQVTVNWSINPVPEPSTAVSMLIGAGLLALWARRRRAE
jgi:hypothetical protein